MAGKKRKKRIAALSHVAETRRRKRRRLDERCARRQEARDGFAGKACAGEACPSQAAAHEACPSDGRAPRPAEGADEAAAADAGRNIVDASGNVLDLAQIRIRIDGVDEKIQTLISERAQLAQLVGISKSKDGLDNRRLLSPGTRSPGASAWPKPATKAPCATKKSCACSAKSCPPASAQQEPLKVAYLGPEGTFTQAAVMTHFGHSVRGLALPSIDEVFHEVEAANADFGVVPIENSTGRHGQQHPRPLPQLAAENLRRSRAAHPSQPDGQPRRRSIEIKRICAHPQALAQCRGWLDEHLPEVERVPVSSNAEGARRARDEKGTAAIAGETAAEVYKLKILGRRDRGPRRQHDALLRPRPQALQGERQRPHRRCSSRSATPIPRARCFTCWSPCPGTR